jgi:hypothetical protein
VTIRTGVTPPVAFIDTPEDSIRYEIGKTISFSGRAEPASDVELTWLILQRHNQHEHLVAEVTGTSGSFTPEEHCDNCGYELCLSAKGEGELIDQTCRLVPPLTAEYTFASDPPGATIAYIDEEKEVLAPYVARPIVGSRQTISASPLWGGRTFSGWSDGLKDAVRTFVVRAAPQAFIATYKNKPPQVKVGLVRARASSGRSVKLDAGASLDPEGEPLRFSWRFSDGKVLRGARITRKFRRSGTYSVTLTVRDALGAKAIYRARITVAKRVSVRQVRL